jgi:hypothetical protein
MPRPKLIGEEVGDRWNPDLAEPARSELVN